jgi:hypothetical protein
MLNFIRFIRLLFVTGYIGDHATTTYEVKVEVRFTD